MAKLAAGRIADGSHQVPDRTVARKSRSEAGLESRSGRQRPESRAHDGGCVDQRRQLWPHGELASGQQAIDGLIEAFGGRAGGQDESPREVRAFSILANTAERASLHVAPTGRPA